MRAVHDEGCSVAACAEIIGAKWTALLVHDLSEGPRRFTQLEHSCPGISPRTLAERLRVLEHEGPWLLVVHRPPRRMFDPAHPISPGFEPLIDLLARRPAQAVVSGHLSRDAEAEVLAHVLLEHAVRAQRAERVGVEDRLEHRLLGGVVLVQQMKEPLDHGHDLITLYGHLSSVAVVPGQHVTRGQVIGYVGQSGRATGPHLHYEVRISNEPVNPRPFLPGAEE